MPRSKGETRDPEPDGGKIPSEQGDGNEGKPAAEAGDGGKRGDLVTTNTPGKEPSPNYTEDCEKEGRKKGGKDENKEMDMNGNIETEWM